jgi:hypothetical protein
VQSSVLSDNPKQLKLALAPGVTVTATAVPKLMPPSTGTQAAAAEGSSATPSAGLYAGADMWVGEVDGYPGAASIAALGTIGDKTFGFVRWIEGDKARKFVVESVKGGLSVIQEVKEVFEERKMMMPDLSKLGRQAASASQPAANTTEQPAGGSRRLLASAGRALLQSSSASRVDVLLLGTAAAASKAGGFDALSNIMRSNVAVTNKALLDSGVDAYLNIVGIRQVSYSEWNKDGGATLGDAQAGRIPNVHAWRDELGADMVTLYANTPDCGVGYVLSNPSGWGADTFAYTQVGGQCFSGLTYAHELGHNFGCGHNAATDRGRDGISYPGNDAFGWRVCTGSAPFKTIMSYSCRHAGFNVNTPEVPIFSRPDRFYANQAVGHSSDAHCARYVRAAVPAIAQFRAQKNATPPPPTPPTPTPPPPTNTGGSSKCVVTMYEHGSYRGRRATATYTWQRQRGALCAVLPNFFSTGFNDIASSTGLVCTCAKGTDCRSAHEGTTIAFFADTDFAGAQLSYTMQPTSKFCTATKCSAFLPNLHQYGWGDRASSLKMCFGGAAASAESEGAEPKRVAPKRKGGAGGKALAGTLSAPSNSTGVLVFEVQGEQ